MRLRLKGKGFTLLELMIASGVLVIVLTGLLSAYISCLEMNETTKNSNLALGAVQEELENLRKAPFQTLNTTYTFYATGPLANFSLGRVAIDKTTNSSFYRVDAGMCWKQRNSRVIGECIDNNGTLVFNDTNGNGILDSPVQLTTYMAQR
ncbi:MAG: type II secretion system protein [Candidatus Omnitrophota bacterium]